MSYDYMIYIFIFIGLLFGFTKGFFKTLAGTIRIGASIAVIVFFYTNILDFVSNTIKIDFEAWYNNQNAQFVVNLLNINVDFYKFLIVGLPVIILINLIFAGLFKLIFFRNPKKMSGKNKFFGGLMGLVQGVGFAIIFMFLICGLTEVTTTGYITTLLLKIPNLAALISSVSQVVI